MNLVPRIFTSLRSCREGGGRREKLSYCQIPKLRCTREEEGGGEKNVNFSGLNGREKFAYFSEKYAGKPYCSEGSHLLVCSKSEA